MLSGNTETTLVKVTVHSFRVYDPYKDDWYYPPRKSPAEQIRRIRGEIVPGTAEEVDSSQLDAEGRYNPSQSKLNDVPDS